MEKVSKCYLYVSELTQTGEMQKQVFRNTPQRYNKQKYIPECKNKFHKMCQILHLRFISLS